METIEIKKVEGVKLLGKNINMREVEIEDAEFILSLRSNPDLMKYVSTPESSLQQQVEYIKNHKKLKNQYYLICETKDGKSLGVVRIHSITGNSFKQGGWIISPDAPRLTAMEAVLLYYDFAFNTLNLQETVYDVVKENDKVVGFHFSMGAKIISEDEQNFYFRYTKEDFMKAREKYKRFLVNND